MSSVDLLYHRRDEVVRLSSKLATMLESNFKRTNDLIDCIHKYIPGKRFGKIKVDHNETVKRNCQMIKARLIEIQEFMDEKARDIKRNIDSSMYDKLMSTDTKFIDRVRYARNVARVVDLGLSVGFILLIVLIRKGLILASIVAKLGVVMTSVVASVALGVLGLGLDAIVSVIIGHIERSKLEKAIKELEDAIRTFEPASDKFNREIERVIIRIEDAFE